MLWTIQVYFLFKPRNTSLVTRNRQTKKVKYIVRRSWITYVTLSDYFSSGVRLLLLQRKMVIRICWISLSGITDNVSRISKLDTILLALFLESLKTKIVFTDFISL